MTSIAENGGRHRAARGIQGTKIVGEFDNYFRFANGRQLTVEIRLRNRFIELLPQCRMRADCSHMTIN